MKTENKCLLVAMFAWVMFILGVVSFNYGWLPHVEPILMIYFCMAAFGCAFFATIGWIIPFDQ